MLKAVRDKELATILSANPKPEGVDDEALLTVIRVVHEWDHWRLDQIVHATYPRMSRTRAQGVVETSAFAPEGRKLRPGMRLRAGSLVLLYRPKIIEPVVEAKWVVLYEDDHLLAIDKPAGLPVHPTARYHRYTVTTALRESRPGEFLTLCHRIDRETSGVLLIAKTREAERIVKRALEDRGIVQKSYLAITWGTVNPPEGCMAFPIKPDEANPLRVKMRVCHPDDRDAMQSATRYRVLETTCGGEYALVECDLDTGRQHQIRLHLSTMGTPIVGDKLYGPDDELFSRGADGELTEDDFEQLELPRHALHAHILRLPHPITREPLEIIAPLPPDLARFWQLNKAHNFLLATARAPMLLGAGGEP
jgi:23S rRNA pseudouridine1911/1915/1917 synthase